MVKINNNYQKLAESYLFSTIGKKVNSFINANPDKKVIRLGIGDVTRPLTPTIINTLHSAVDEMADASTFKGYAPDLGYEFLRKAIADNDFKNLSGAELKEAIEKSIKEKDSNLVGNMASQGTTPRQLTDLIGSLCDLTSGSGDKGTPIVLVQGYFDNYTAE